MEISIKDLFEGKSTIIKNKEFKSTKDYVAPFIDRMSKYTEDFRISVKMPDQITTSKNNPDVTYNRVLIQAVMPESYFNEDNHRQVIGMLYGLDVKTPVYKFYKGGLNMACTNLTVFSPEFLNVQELEPETALNYSPIQQLLDKEDKLKLYLDKMHSTYLDSKRLKEELGKWVDFTLRHSFNAEYGKIKIASSTPIDVYKNLVIDSDSEYYIPAGIEPDLFTVYNAFTDIITNDKGKDIMNKYEKICLISSMLGLND
jgi:hypothetical protein